LRNLVRQEQKTAIVVTHDARIFGYADRILHLENGVICRESSPQSPEEMSVSFIPQLLDCSVSHA
jgi:putative ABC transport system ATP-binding protein